MHRPIGPDNGKKYNATFDGQGHRIKNMIINRPNNEMQGFFGSLRGNPNSRGEGTVIKNLIMGIVGSYVGTFISHLLNIELLGKGYFTNFVFCVVGAVTVLWLWKKLFD